MTEQDRHDDQDTRRAERHVREAEENRDALADQARRVERTTPPEVERTGRLGEG